MNLVERAGAQKLGKISETPVFARLSDFVPNNNIIVNAAHDSGCFHFSHASCGFITLTLLVSAGVGRIYRNLLGFVFQNKVPAQKTETGHFARSPFLHICRMPVTA